MPKYINSIKVKPSKYGLKVSAKFEDLISELKQHVNEKGYVNLDFNPRKEVGKYGQTHSVTVDEWKPPQPNNKIPNDEIPDGFNSPFQDDLPF